MKREQHFDDRDSKHTKYDHKSNKVDIPRTSTVIGNYFPIKQAKPVKILQYDVSCTQLDMEPGALSRFVHFKLGSDNPFVYDGGKMLWMVSNSDVPEIDELTITPDEKTVITLKITKDKDISVGQVFNVLTKSLMSHLCRKGKNGEPPRFMRYMNAFYDLNRSLDMRDFGGVAYQGFKGTTHAELFQIAATTRFFPNVRMSSNPKDLQGKNNFVIRTLHTNKIVFIDKVSVEQTPKNTFFKVGGKDVSLPEYYLSTYKHVVKDLNSPLLVRKDQKGGISYFLPELSAEWGDSHSDTRFKMAMIKHANVPPKRKFDEIKNFVNILKDNKSAQEALASWGYAIGNDFESFNSELYQTPVIEFGNTTMSRSQWDIRSEKMFKSPKPEGRYILVIEPPYVDSGRNAYSGKDTDSFLDQWEKNAESLGLPWRDFKIKIKSVSGRGYGKDYEDVLFKAFEEFGKEGIIFIVPIIPRKDKEVYGKIKKVVVERGFSSQIVVAETLNGKGVLSKITKINVQICAKLQGVPWKLKESGHLDKVMFVGIDSAKGYIGFVASIGQYRHYSRCGVESKVDVFMEKALDEFKYETKSFPTNVIIYRAGEKKELLVDKETSVLMKCIDSVTKGASKGIAFWLDTKPGARFVDNRYENVPAGTVVNNPGSKLDFYLISVATRQGTAVPVLFRCRNQKLDDSMPKIETIKRWTFELCHLYSNWWGTIKVPSVVLYATKMVNLYQGGVVQIKENDDHKLARHVHYI
jgi:hypothetical protein